MAAKLREKDGFYWVVVHYQGSRKWKKIGKNKREAQKVVHKVNAQLALGKFSMEGKRSVPTIAEALQRWHEDYTPTFSPSYAQLAEINIRLHLIPAFGKLLISEISERDLLHFLGQRTSPDWSPRPLKVKTLSNILSVLARVLALAVENGELTRNPCRNLGNLIKKVERRQADEVSQVDSWSRREVAALLELAQEREPDFYPVLAFLLSTGCRKGEALGLKWPDINFDEGHILIRRALVRGRLVPPKSGKARSVVISPLLASLLQELVGLRRWQSLKHGWPDVPEFVFCSEAGGPLDARNVNRVWDRLRRKAQKVGVRPLRLHDARHTFASLALASGKSVRWVASQLGHSDPALTLRVYAHALREEESDLSFLDFGGVERHPRGTKRRAVTSMRKPARATPRRTKGTMARREGFEPPTLRFEA